MLDPIPTRPLDEMPRPDVRTRDEAHEIRQAPAMPDINLRETLAPEIEELLNSTVITEEQRLKLRKSIVDHFNRAVNIPVIGEHIEEILFTFVLKVVEKIVLAFAGQLKDRILRAID